MSTPINDVLMARAIELSQLGFPAPNPHVGCVIEKAGEIVGEGYHDHAGGPHAEVAALREAGAKATGATAYVSMEPCNHHGRTGPCSEALIEAGVRRVVLAVMDPNPRAAGGAQRLREAGVEVVEGVMRAEAEQANIMWLTAVRRGRPYVVGKAAISLDGRTALPNGSSQWITSQEARVQSHVLRADCGAVLVGKGTIEKDDAELTVRHVKAINQPLRIVLDSRRELESNRKVFNQAAPYLRVVKEDQHPRDLEVKLVNDLFLLEDLLQKLYTRGVTSLLVEGGSLTLSHFMSQGLVDRLELFLAGKVLGGGPTWTTFGSYATLEDVRTWQFKDVRRIGPDIWITASPEAL